MNDTRNINRWQQQLRKGLIEFLVLLHLEREDHYGYSMMQELQGVLKSEVSEGTIYPLLKRLESENYVESYWEIMESGPARKYYRSTKSGTKTLNHMYKVWEELCGSIVKLRKL